MRAHDHVVDGETLQGVHEVSQQLGLGHRPSLAATSCRIWSGVQSGCLARKKAVSRARASSHASWTSLKRSIPDFPAQNPGDLGIEVFDSRGITHADPLDLMAAAISRPQAAPRSANWRQSPA